MKNKNLNEIAQIEKAIKEKYGEEAIQNPKGSWTKEKEEKYLKELRSFYNSKNVLEETFELEGFILKNKKTTTQEKRSCPVCKKYSTKSKDDLYMVKFKCCFECYIKYVQGREERWKTGWRPNR